MSEVRYLSTIVERHTYFFCTKFSATKTSERGVCGAAFFFVSSFLTPSSRYNPRGVMGPRGVAGVVESAFSHSHASAFRHLSSR
jgi:hypothetical protein